ncbi:MAG: hypothetical protein DRO18_07020 [Thermoprotei archaeon]|nr:MAG: hypothetical protein DRO18_07020 [Thermoprotei archaeon]
MKSGTNVNKKKLIEFVRRKVEELEEELNFYKQLLMELTGKTVHEEVKSKPLSPDNVKVIAIGNDIIANIVELRDSVRIMLRESIPSNNPLLNSFLLQLLRDKKELGEMKDFEVKENKGYVTEIVIRGINNKSLVKEVEIALRYLWKEVHREK